MVLIISNTTNKCHILLAQENGNGGTALSGVNVMWTLNSISYETIINFSS